MVLAIDKMVGCLRLLGGGGGEHLRLLEEVCLQR